MNIDHRNPRLRRGFAFVALAALLGLSVVGLSQCRMVDDTVTGVELQGNTGLNARSDCVHQCNDKYKACRKAEDARHKAALRACDDGENNNDNNNNDDSGEKACKKAEKRLHKENKAACREAMQDCKRNCYNEGAGIGGR
jgi:hypothetical protein